MERVEEKDEEGKAGRRKIVRGRKSEMTQVRERQTEKATELKSRGRKKEKKVIRRTIRGT